MSQLPSFDVSLKTQQAVAPPQIPIIQKSHHESLTAENNVSSNTKEQKQSTNLKKLYDYNDDDDQDDLQDTAKHVQQIQLELQLKLSEMNRFKKEMEDRKIKLLQLQTDDGERVVQCEDYQGEQQYNPFKVKEGYVDKQLKKLESDQMSENSKQEKEKLQKILAKIKLNTK